MVQRTGKIGAFLLNINENSSFFLHYNGSYAPFYCIFHNKNNKQESGNMNEPQSYRAFTLQSLRTGPLEIAEKISEHKGLMQSAEAFIEKSVYRLVLFWSLGVSAFLAVGGGLFLRNIYVGIGIFVVLVIGSFMATQIRYVKTRLMASGRYSAQHEQIRRSAQAIEELRNNAKAYQERLEISNGPGFIVTFMDILLSQYYPSFFSLDDRARFLYLSEKGRGAEMDVFEYARVLFELKANGIEEYVNHENIVEKIPAQNKYNAAVAFARTIAFNPDKATEDDMRFTALVGLNAWIVYQAQGRPGNWENHQHMEWEIVRRILEHSVAKNTLGLVKAISELMDFDERHKKQG
jgi:hypothetical protein